LISFLLMLLQGAEKGSKKRAAAQQVPQADSDSESSEDEASDADEGKAKGKLRSRQKESARRKAEQDIRNREVCLFPMLLLCRSVTVSLRS
jgi:hypothetical protein